jgi:cytochrome c553
VVARGGEVYATNCAVCHGNNGVQRGSSFPNLTLSALLYSQEGFDQVVLQGARLQRGMPNFSDKLSAEDSVAAREFIIARANEVKNNPPAPGGFGAPPPAANNNAAGNAARPAQQAAPPPEDEDIHEAAADN